MIARNYMKHPEALRFQRELFSNGFHNSPRIMRLMECMFDWTPVAPDWWTAAKAKARALAKAVKKSIADFFKETKVHQLKFCFTAEEAKQPKPATTIDGVAGMTVTLSLILRNAGVMTLDELAELCVDELEAITGQTPEKAREMIIAARAHWFH